MTRKPQYPVEYSSYYRCDAKRCAECLNLRPVTMFGRRSTKEGRGYKAVCNPCRRIKGREYRKKNEEKIVARRRAYYLQNKEKLAENKRRYIARKIRELGEAEFWARAKEKRIKTIIEADCPSFYAYHMSRQTRRNRVLKRMYYTYQGRTVQLRKAGGIPLISSEEFCRRMGRNRRFCYLYEKHRAENFPKLTRPCLAPFPPGLDLLDIESLPIYTVGERYQTLANLRKDKDNCLHD